MRKNAGTGTTPAFVHQSEPAPAESMKGENRRLSASIPEIVLLFAVTDKNKIGYRLPFSEPAPPAFIVFEDSREKPPALQRGGGFLAGDKSDGANQTRPRIAPGESWRLISAAAASSHLAFEDFKTASTNGRTVSNSPTISR